MGSLLAAWRVSLRRTRADLPIVAAAWLITLIAAVLLAAGPIYASAASLAGLHRSLADAPPAETVIVVSVYAAPDHVGAIDGRVVGELDDAMAPLGGSVVRDVRNSGGVAFAPSSPGASGGAASAIPVLGARDGLADHATLVAGAWPSAAAGASDPVPVAVADAVASALDLQVGSDVALVSRQVVDPSAPAQDVPVPVRVVGIFRVDDPRDPYWGGDVQLTDGVVDASGSRTVGPFFMTAHDLLARAGLRQVRALWTAVPGFDQLTVDDVGALEAGVSRLAGRLRGGVDPGLDVRTGLGDILGAADRSLLVSRAAVVLLMAQLAILAGYAIVLIAGMLVEQRRLDTSMLMARGAGASQVALLALAEGLLLAIPAATIAPWVVVAVISVLDQVGPLADAGLRIQPQVTTDAYLLGGAAALLCVVLLVAPAVLAARRFAAEQQGMSRAETRPFAQRLGIETALLAVAAVALIQLRFYGAPLTRTVQGSLGLDPLLVAAPAIGLLAGGILALRVLPILAQWAEGAISRRRDLVGSLGSRQLARRPLRYTRSALLLMLALSMGVFSVSYVSTWSGSQRDQAAYQAGAAIRVTPSQAKDAPSGWALPGAYAAIPGVAAMSPVERQPGGLDYANRSADLMTVDADTAGGIVLFRADESATSLAGLMTTLRDGRPTQGLVEVPPGTASLRVTPRLEIQSIRDVSFDFTTGEQRDRALDPAMVDVGIRVSVLVRGPGGLLERIQSDVALPHGRLGPLTLTLPAVPSGGAGASTQPRSYQIAGLGVDILLPTDVVIESGRVGIGAVETAPAASGPWTAVPIDRVGPWAATTRQGRQAPQAVPSGSMDGTSVRIGEDPSGVFFGQAAAQPSWQVTLLAASLAPPDVVLPAIVNRAFLAKTSAGPGDTFAATFEGGVRRLRIAGVVEDFPTTDPSRPLVILDESTLATVRLRLSGSVRSPDEWWLATTGDSASVAAVLSASPLRSASVTTADARTRSLSTDPIAVGIIGALILGFLATGLVALVGLTVSAAVSARQRRTEFALLRALGLSGSQLSSWLWLENGSLVLVSLVGGTALGVLIGWLVLPFVTVTQQATAPVPPVIVRVPWDGVVLLDLASAVAAGLAVIVIGSVLRRRGVGSVLRMGED